MTEDREQAEWVDRMSAHVAKLGIEQGLHEYVEGLRRDALREYVGPENNDKQGEEL